MPASEFISGKRSYTTDSGVLTLKAAADSGRKVVMSFKWDSAGKGDFGRMPGPGSKKEAEAFAFADHLLQATSGKLTALVVVNELSIDTLPEDLAPNASGSIPVIVFLQRLTTHIAAEHLKAADGAPLPIFGGGMTRLDKLATQQSPATKAMIAFVNSDPSIAGADYHIHQPNMETTRTAVEYMHKAVPNKPLMITEMSLVWKWKAHLMDKVAAQPAGQAFVQQYSLPSTLTVAQFANLAYAHPVPESEWKQFMASQSWFDGHYLAQLMPLLQANGVKIALYALTLDPNPSRAHQPRPITDKTVPWFFNQLLMPGMAIVSNSTRFAENYELFDDYVHYQQAGK